MLTTQRNLHHIQIDDLKGSLLDYYVAVALNLNAMIDTSMDVCLIRVPRDPDLPGKWIVYQPSQRAEHAVPLQERFNISVEFEGCVNDEKFWTARYGYMPAHQNDTTVYGNSIYDAISRCVIKENIGEIIDVETYPIIEG